MIPNPPPVLENYRYDEDSSKTPLPARILGWLSLLIFMIAVSSTFFLSGEQMIMMCYISYGGFVGLFSAYVVVKIVTRHSRCSRCRRIMDDIDVQWTPDTWQQIQGYELMGSVTGADGKLYTIEREKNAGSTTYFIYAHFQQWCADCSTDAPISVYSKFQVFPAYWEHSIGVSVSHSCFFDVGSHHFFSQTFYKNPVQGQSPILAQDLL